MSEALITPRIVTWARERANLTLDSLADLLKIKVDKLSMWEKGERKPTFNQAQKLAKKLEIPFGYLYLDEPPKEELKIPDLRTFNNSPVVDISPEFRKLLNEIISRQEWYKDYVIENGLSEKYFLENFSIKSNKFLLISDIKEKLGLDVYIAKRLKPRYFLNKLVEKIELLDILVMKNGILGSNTHKKLNLNEFRGFAIYDKFAPLIFLNSNDSLKAQIFTLLHEVVHLWIGESGISLIDFNNINNETELFCNEITAQLLVPENNLNQYWDATLNFESHYEELSELFTVSTLMILNRLYSLKYIDFEKYSYYSGIEKQKFEMLSRTKRQNDSGDFYKTLKSRIGKNFSHALLESTLEGRTSYKDASYLLGTSSTNIKSFAQEVGIIK